MKVCSSAATLAVLAAIALVACGSDEPASSSGPAAATTGGGAGVDGSGGGAGSTGGSAGGDATTPPDASTPVPIDSSRKLADLSRAERGTLCDWSQNMLGGYGMMYECGGGIAVANAKDQEECAGNPWPKDCGATVAELEMCVRAQAPSHGCIRPPECDRIIAC